MDLVALQHLGPSQVRDSTGVSRISGRCFTIESLGKTLVGITDTSRSRVKILAIVYYNPAHIFKRKQNSWVICKYLPVAGGNLRNCSSKNYLLLDYMGLVPKRPQTTRRSLVTTELICQRWSQPIAWSLEHRHWGNRTFTVKKKISEAEPTASSSHEKKSIFIQFWINHKGGFLLFEKNRLGLEPWMSPGKSEI